MNTKQKHAWEKLVKVLKTLADLPEDTEPQILLTTVGERKSAEKSCIDTGFSIYQVSLIKESPDTFHPCL